MHIERRRLGRVVDLALLVELDREERES